MSSLHDESTRREQRIQEDGVLVDAIVGGSVDAWHGFVEKYSGLIFRVIKRHLPGEREDGWRNVYVDILEELYKRALAKYNRRAPLAFWLVVFTRRRALDALRSRHGRIREPKGLSELDEFEREVFQLHHVERRRLYIIIHTLKWRGYEATADKIVAAIVRIDKTIAPRYLKRLDEERFARRNGTDPYRELHYLVDRRTDFEHRSAASSPDRALMEKEAQDTADRVRQLVAGLSEDERRIIELRFGKGMGANEISDALGLGGQRRAYTLIDRVLRKLRAAMNGSQGSQAVQRRPD